MPPASGQTVTAMDPPIIQAGVYKELAAADDEMVYVIVMLQPVAMPPPGQQAQLRERVAAIQNRVLVRLALDEFHLVYQYENLAALTGWVNAAGLATLAVDPDVTAVGLDAEGEAHLDVSVPFIGADKVQEMGFTGAGITVAVLDTGIDTDHADLSDNFADGAYHFLDKGATKGPGAEDDNGHGTNVSGIITSKGTVASAGVAPDTDILAIKVLKANGKGWISDWAAGVNYVINNRHNYTNLVAINMSLGSKTLYPQCPCDNVDADTRLLQEAIGAAKNAGIVTFASSGNKGSCGSMSAPACLSTAVAVAAVYDQDMGREPDYPYTLAFWLLTMLAINVFRAFYLR